MDQGAMYSETRSIRAGGAKGRIAQVLAQARASLSEPIRPQTPQSLDMKVNSLPSNLDYQSIGIGKLKTKKVRNVAEILDISSGRFIFNLFLKKKIYYNFIFLYF